MRCLGNYQTSNCFLYRTKVLLVLVDTLTFYLNYSTILQLMIKHKIIVYSERVQFILNCNFSLSTDSYKECYTVWSVIYETRYQEMLSWYHPFCNALLSWYHIFCLHLLQLQILFLGRKEENRHHRHECIVHTRKIRLVVSYIYSLRNFPTCCDFCFIKRVRWAYIKVRDEICLIGGLPLCFNSRIKNYI